jgi:transposase
VPRASGKIVFDKFHVVQYVTKAVDKVRKAENSELADRGLDWLKNTKWLWLANEENIPEWRRPEFEELKNKDLKVARAWSIKENLRHFWGFKTKSAAEKFFKKWYWWATHSRLKPMIEAAKTIKRHLENILTYFTHQVTNALGESINSKIEKIKKTACGYRNREHYKTAIYFHCGGLDLYPNINS